MINKPLHQPAGQVAIGYVVTCNQACQQINCRAFVFSIVVGGLHNGAEMAAM
jgi:hypothetical protein